MPKKNTPSIEEMLGQIEDLAGLLENNEIPLTDALKAFEQGVKLTRQAQKTLAEAEQRVQVLLDKDDSPEATAFPGEPDE